MNVKGVGKPMAQMEQESGWKARPGKHQKARRKTGRKMGWC
jgi:hypothetical protein